MAQASVFDAVDLGTLTISEVLGALSHALDMTEGQPPGHCLRCCLMGVAIGRELGLAGDAAADLYYTLLLKDLGCSSNAARICQLYLADDLEFKRGFKTVDGSMRQAIAFVLRHTGPDKGLMTRLNAIRNVLSNSDDIIHGLFESRCQQGAEIASLMGFSPAVAEGVAGLDEHWDGGGRPARLSGEAIPLASRIALLAQVLDVFFLSAGPDAALAEVTARSGRWFDPDVVRAAQSAAARPGFWGQLGEAGLAARVAGLQPGQDRMLLDDNVLDEMVNGFARVIDAKSPFTHGHSARVALYTDLLTEAFGFGDTARRWMRRTALLHDIGKLGVSNTILDKPERLTAEEFSLMKRHPLLSEEVLARVAVFGELARVAVTHHERLDGAGYPRGLAADALSLEMRILTVADIFDAISADRPYRAAMPIDQVWGVLDDMSGAAVDGDVVAAMKDVVAQSEGLFAG